MPPATLATAGAATPGMASNSTGVHLDFIDGIRGLSALFVVFHHVFLMLQDAEVGHHGGLAGRALAILRPLIFGRYAVDMFIVVSGFCLMLPTLKRNAGLPRGSFQGYIKRRARRILPPYYAALVLSLLLIPLLHSWRAAAGMPQNDATAWPVAGNLISHALMVHNLFNNWSHTINTPMWSVATEWQIYFLFPTVLLPVWRRYGALATVILGYGLGLAVHRLVPGGLAGAAPWFLGLFALGMAGAALSFPAPDAPPGRRLPWGVLALLLTGALVVVGTIVRGWFHEHQWLVDPVFGLAAMCFMVYCVQSSADTMPNSIVRMLSSRWAVVLGTFSYSLYLTHYPLLSVAATLLQQAHVSLLAQIVATFGLYVPTALVCAYAFYILFERPFMPGRPQTTQAAHVAATVSPAP